MSERERLILLNLNVASRPRLASDISQATGVAQCGATLGRMREKGWVSQKWHSDRSMVMGEVAYWFITDRGRAELETEEAAK